MSLDNLLQTGAEAAMMMGADTRGELYGSMDRMNKQIDLNTVSDILAGSELDFDNPATFGPVMQQLDQVTPGLGAKIGKQLYAISDERMKAASTAAMNYAHGKDYLNQAGLFDANAGRVNYGTQTLKSGVESGEIPAETGARVAFKTAGDLSTAGERTKRAVDVKNIGAEADKYNSDQQLKWENYGADQRLKGENYGAEADKYNSDQRLKWEKYGSDAKANADRDVARIKANGEPSSSKFSGKIDDDTFKDILTTGANIVKQMFPDVQGIINEDKSVGDSTAMALRDAYRVGLDLSKNTGGPKTMAGVLALGLDYLVKNGKLKVEGTTIPGKPATGISRLWSAGTPDTPAKQLVYPAQGGVPQENVPSGNGASIPDYMRQGPASPSLSSAVTQTPTDKVVARQQAAPDATAVQKFEETIQSITDEAQQFVNDMVSRRPPKDNTVGAGDKFVAGVKASNPLERVIKSGVQGLLNVPHYLMKDRGPSLSETLQSQARQSIDPRKSPEQLLVDNITFKLKAAGVNNPADIEQLVKQILQSINPNGSAS